MVILQDGMIAGGTWGRVQVFATGRANLVFSYRREGGMILHCAFHASLPVNDISVLSLLLN